MHTKAIATIFIFSVTALCISFAHSEVTPQTTTNRSHPFVLHLESLYYELTEIEKEGNVDAYWKIRSKYVVNVTKKHLTKSNKTEEFPEMLRKLSKRSKSLNKYTFIRCETSKNIARLSYSKDYSEDKIEYFILMYHNEGEEWKIGIMKHDFKQKIKKDGSLTSLEDALNDSQLSLN